MSEPTEADPVIRKLPHWLHIALHRIAEHADIHLDTNENFPCLLHPQKENPESWGCSPPNWCLNCERSAGIQAACLWILNGMDLNHIPKLPG